MIKINLIAEKKQTKAKPATTGLKLETGSGGRNVLLVAILVVGFGVAAIWTWSVTSTLKDWEVKHREADAELQRLEEVRKKGEEYKVRKELLARKIDLITELKKKQEVPVHILDQISKNLPDFLWLERMTASDNALSIVGKATTYNAVSNFYNNLEDSGFFTNVALGRTYEADEGVVFSLSCAFVVPQQAQQPPQESAGPETQG